MRNLKNTCPECNKPKGVYAKHCKKCWVNHRSNIRSSKPEIIEMLKTRNYTLSEIARKFGVTRQVIKYHYVHFVKSDELKSYKKRCLECGRFQNKVKNITVHISSDRKEYCSDCYIQKLKKEGVI